MKRLIAAVSLAVIAAPALADNGPTDPIMPAAPYEASAGATVSQVSRPLDLGPTDPIMSAYAGATSNVDRAYARQMRAEVERSTGYFDPA